MVLNEFFFKLVHMMQISEMMTFKKPKHFKNPVYDEGMVNFFNPILLNSSWLSGQCKCVLVRSIESVYLFYFLPPPTSWFIKSFVAFPRKHIHHIIDIYAMVCVRVLYVYLVYMWGLRTEDEDERKVLLQMYNDKPSGVATAPNW